jgi:hypothetical protein
MIQVSSYSAAGGHATNEDVFEVCPHPHDPAVYLCALADGQGGRAGGLAAARLSCRACVATASQQTPGRLMLPHVWMEILRAADAAVAADPAAGFTTLVAFCVTEARLCGASCGDSAAVVLAELGQVGNIVTARQHKNPPVGSGEASAVPFAATLRPPWTLLAMSDGVWKYAGWENILALDPRQPGHVLCRTLLERACLPGSLALQDDFTLVVIQEDGAL